MTVPDGTRDPDALRAQGNVSFKKGQFSEAARLYSEAIQLKSEPRLFSNRSAAKYEAGLYQECLLDVQKAFDCTPAPDDALASKLASRAARAALWLGRFEEAKDWTDRADASGDTAERIRACLQASAQSDASDEVLVHQIAYSRDHRGWWKDEYFTQGHDEPRSLLHGKADRNEDLLKMNVPWGDGSQEERTEISAMLGGSGDARHVLMTLVDAAERCPDPSTIKLRLVANDHLRECVARLLVLFAILDQVGPSLTVKDPQASGSRKGVESASRVDDGGGSTSKDAAREEDSCYVLHTYLSNWLAPPLHGRLMRLLDELAVAEECPLPFVSCVGDTWAQLRTTLRDWRECHYSHSDCMLLYEQAMTALKQSASFAQEMSRAATRTKRETEHQEGLELILSNVETGTEDEIEMIISSLPDEFQNKVRRSSNPRAALKKVIPVAFQLAEDGLDDLSDINVENAMCFGATFEAHMDFVEQSGRLPWPPALKQIYGDEEEMGIMPNPLTAPALPPYNPRTGAPLFDPFTTLRELLMNDVIDFDSPCVRGGVEGWTLTDYSDHVFGRVAGALRRLVDANALQISLDIGDTFTLARRVAQAQGQDAALPRLFDRVHINNICDYEGMLPALLHITPTLKAAPHAWLTHSVLYAPSEYTDFDHYVQACTVLPTVDHAQQLLGLKYNSVPTWEPPPGDTRDRGIWGEDACWIAALGDAPDLSRCTQDKLASWVHDVAAQIVFPPQRDIFGRRQYLHQWPLTLAVFFAVLERLHERFPRHWIDGALRPLGVTAAQLPATSVSTARVELAGNDTPVKCDTWSPGATARRQQTYFAAAHDELRALGALWSHRLPALLATPGGATVCCYEMQVYDEHELYSSVMQTLKTKGRVLGLLIMPGDAPGLEVTRRVSASTGVMSIVQHGHTMPRHGAQLFSAVQWIAREREGSPGFPSRWARFWMLEETFKAKADWKGYAFGADTWAVASKPFSLSDAVEVDRVQM